ncbi:hypothetical protein GCM10022263_42710 [Nocardioides daeguensis]|uniref:Uncharacterized protein n=1 Tax=Nocardioides daeguensis TaxID=908359 RepID=A0ABP6WG74_9ACTN
MRQDFFGWIEKPDAVSGNAAITAARWPLSGLAAAHDYEKSAPHDGTTVADPGAVVPDSSSMRAGGLHESPDVRGFMRLSGFATPDKRMDPLTGVTGGAAVTTPGGKAACATTIRDPRPAP